jgi:hypothetical protein
VGSFRQPDPRVSTRSRGQPRRVHSEQRRRPPVPETLLYDSMLSPTVQPDWSWYTSVPGSFEWNAGTFAMVAPHVSLSGPIRIDQTVDATPRGDGCPPSPAPPEIVRLGRGPGRPAALSMGSHEAQGRDFEGCGSSLRPMPTMGGLIKMKHPSSSSPRPEITPSSNLRAPAAVARHSQTLHPCAKTTRCQWLDTLPASACTAGDEVCLGATSLANNVVWGMVLGPWSNA